MLSPSQGWVPLPAGTEPDPATPAEPVREGQNLQQAQAVVSYDMPWNPQRVVQRNGRVIRLLSEHEEVHLVTMLVDGELERLLRLEARVRAKISAASGIYGMESAVIEGLETDAPTSWSRTISRCCGASIPTG